MKCVYCLSSEPLKIGPQSLVDTGGVVLRLVMRTQAWIKMHMQWLTVFLMFISDTDWVVTSQPGVQWWNLMVARLSEFICCGQPAVPWREGRLSLQHKPDWRPGAPHNTAVRAGLASQPHLTKPHQTQPHRLVPTSALSEHNRPNTAAVAGLIGTDKKMIGAEA